jgi:hypothetical protein
MQRSIPETSTQCGRYRARSDSSALDFAHLSADRFGGNVQKWLDESAMAQDTAETERDQTELGGEG